jgi:hypothetical protein
MHKDAMQKREEEYYTHSILPAKGGDVGKAYV